MLLQDKEINFAHTLLKESPSKIKGSFARLQDLVKNQAFSELFFWMRSPGVC